MHTWLTLNQTKSFITVSCSSAWSSRLLCESPEAASVRIIRNPLMISTYYFITLQFYFPHCFLFSDCLFTVTSALLHCLSRVSFSPSLLFFFNFFLFLHLPHQFTLSFLSLQTMLLANATHRFNSTFTSHCKSSPQFISFSVLFLWLSVKL